MTDETCFTWILPYLNQKWTEKTDCYHWFARIQREVFGRDTPLIADADYRHQWQVTAKPSDGDAVIMFSHARDVRLHHMVSGTMQTAAGLFMRKQADVFVLIRLQACNNNNGQSGSF